MRLGTLILLVVGFCVGVGLGTVYELPLEAAVWLLVLAAAIGLIWRRKSTPRVLPTASLKRHHFSASRLILSSIFLALGIIRTEVASWQFNVSSLEAELNKVITLTGVIAREPDTRERTVHLYVETEQDLLLVTTDRLNTFAYGDEVEVSGKLERPEVF